MESCLRISFAGWKACCCCIHSISYPLQMLRKIFSVSRQTALSLVISHIFNFNDIIIEVMLVDKGPLLSTSANCQQEKTTQVYWSLRVGTRQQTLAFIITPRNLLFVECKIFVRNFFLQFYNIIVAQQLRKRARQFRTGTEMTSSTLKLVKLQI